MTVDGSWSGEPSAASHDSTDGSKRPPFEAQASRQLKAWLAEQSLSVAFTTYRLGKLFLLGRNLDTDQLSIFERSFARSMGLWTDTQSLYFSSLFQIWRLENFLRAGQWHQGFDRVYVPQVAYTTGDIDVHDMALDAQGRLVFVSALFSCIATLSDGHSFIPLWRPRFVSKLAAEDRCHLNGLAMREGAPAFVSSVSTSDAPDGWRDRRQTGGVVVEIQDSETVCGELCMPHSPRWYREQLWVLNSGRGEFGCIDLSSGRFEPVSFCPGYLRGLAFAGDFAIVGSSLPRHEHAFAGLPLEKALKKRDAEPRCGLYIIDLRSGDIVHWLRLRGMVNELYDVAALPRVIRPMAVGMVSDEIRRVISIGTPEPL